MIKVSKLDKIIFFICVLDILFFPYIRIASASISMILLPIWYLFNLHKIKVKTDFKLFIPLYFLIIISLMLSFVNFSGEAFLITNLKYFVILTYGFLYFFFLKFYFENTSVNIGKILSYYIYFGLTLSIVYLINPANYFNLRSLWTLSGNTIEMSEAIIMNRFTSTFSDPNNAAIIFVAVLAYIIFTQNLSKVKNFNLMVATLVILFSTMSSTGFVLYGMTIALYTFKFLITTNFFTLKKSTLLYCFSLVILSPLIYIIFNTFFDSYIVQAAYERVTENSADSRFLIWQQLLEYENIFKYAFLGMGGSIFISNGVYAPHNGNLHLIYNYGMIAYVLFMIVLFRKRRNTNLYSYFFIVIIFIGYTMNVGFYEPRFTNVFVLLVAGYAGISAHNTYLKRESEV